MKNKKLISLLVTSALLVAPTSAFAGQTSTPKSIPSATSQLDIVGSYSVEDTLKLLLAGTGPVAEKTPNWLDSLGSQMIAPQQMKQLSKN